MHIFLNPQNQSLPIGEKSHLSGRLITIHISNRKWPFFHAFLVKSFLDLLSPMVAFKTGFFQSRNYSHLKMHPFESNVYFFKSRQRLKHITQPPGEERFEGRGDSSVWDTCGTGDVSSCSLQRRTHGKVISSSLHQGPRSGGPSVLR